MKLKGLKETDTISGFYTGRAHSGFAAYQNYLIKTVL